MSKKYWYVWIAAVLLALSASIYLIHFALFHDAHHIFIYLVGDLAFLPLSVLLVTLVVDRLLSERDKRASIEKQNMVIGAFYSELGTELIRKLTAIDPDRGAKQEAMRALGRFDEPDYRRLKAEVEVFDYAVEPDPSSLEDMRLMLVGKRDFMVRLLENPLLLEHETFTDVLWAVFHLTEELDSREGFAALPASDLAHLSGDAGRAYERLTGQWLSYMRHLSTTYPYLYSLAVRLNPFDPDASALVDG